MTIIRWRNRPIAANWMHDALRNSFMTGFEKSCNCSPSANILENDQNFVIQLFIPGISKEEVKIQVENPTLSVSYEKKESTEGKQENYLLREYELDSFSRSFTLPQVADKENILAQFQNGVLHITVPKKEKASVSRNIEIS